MAEVWDETKPAGSRSPQLGDDDIREFKRATRERLALDHEFAATESPAFGETNSVIGMHKRVMLNEQSADPTVAANKGALYTKEAASKSELFWKDEDGHVYQLTKGGKLLIGPGNANGQEMLLDADGDTSLTADTDDQVDIKIAGADQLRLLDGSMLPAVTNDFDIGSDSLRMKNAYLAGNLDVAGNIVQNSVTRRAWKGPINAATLEFTGLGQPRTYRFTFSSTGIMSSLEIRWRFNNDAEANYFTWQIHCHNTSGTPTGPTGVEAVGYGYNRIALMSGPAIESVALTIITGGNKANSHALGMAFSDVDNNSIVHMSGIYVGADPISSVLFFMGSGNLIGNYLLEEIY